jgi:hypothetical protein
MIFITPALNYLLERAFIKLNLFKNPKERGIAARLITLCITIILSCCGFIDLNTCAQLFKLAKIIYNYYSK